MAKQNDHMWKSSRTSKVKPWVLDNITEEQAQQFNEMHDELERMQRQIEEDFLI